MSTGKQFEIAHAESFPLELGRAPKKVQNAYSRTIIPALRSHPDVSDPPRIKRLNDYKNLWRLRVSDEYRLVYRLDINSRLVTMLMLDHRAKIYERLGMNVDGRPGTRIVTDAPDLLEREPSPEETGNALISRADEEPEPKSHPGSALPLTLKAELLSDIGVAEKYFAALCRVRTEGDLMALTGGSVPSDVIARVLEFLWPQKIEEIVQRPVRIAAQPEQLEKAAEGERSLESFLLKLDDDQKSFVSRFKVGRPTGPWLLKGGPGSGKSTVALYCVKALVDAQGSQLPLGDKPLRILLTTFTKSLVNASTHLLHELNVYGGSHTVQIQTVDSLAGATVSSQWKEHEIAPKPREFIKTAINTCKDNTNGFPFSTGDDEFLLDEIEWVLIGQDIKSVDEYFKADRAGRGRALTRIQRQHVWTVYEALIKLLRTSKKALFSEKLREACRHVRPQFDYVFIDEAQDLKPVAIRFCIGLCSDPRNVFLTADTNQSIYGSGLSWSRVASDLKFQGRARILRRNYRTTAQIWRAIYPFAEGSSGVDSETLDIETVYTGPEPIIVRYSNSGKMADRLNSYLHGALKQQRVALGAAAVLCPTSREMEEVIGMLHPRYNAKKMKSSEVDLKHAGVKVMTMHAAKGLQFPVIAVVGVENGRLPLPTPVGIDPEEHKARQKRLLFVACSRAMRSLIVFVNRANPSPFVDNISDEHWEFEEL